MPVPRSGFPICLGPSPDVLVRRLVLRAAGVAAIMWIAGAAPAAAATDDERRVKAVFLYKFVPYVSWPAGLADGNPFVIGATNPDMAREVAEVTAGRVLDGRAIVVRHVREGDPTAGVRLLFVGADEAARLGAIATQTRGQPVLLVTEVPGGLDRGAVINFLLNEGRVRFEVSLPAAESRRLVISSRLLKVAQNVRMGTP